MPLRTHIHYRPIPANGQNGKHSQDIEVSLSFHVVGDDYERELAEMRRVTKPGGWLIICNGDDEFQRKRPDPELTRRGFETFCHESPSGGIIYNYRLHV